MYQDKALQESIKKVEAARAENVKLNPRRMTAEEKDVLLKTFHPDYRDNQLSVLRRRRFGFVFQAYNLVQELTAYENMLLPVMLDAAKPDFHHIAYLTEVLGIGDRLNHLPGALSGGQQQRVAIARALANKPAVLFADEPTGNLDGASGREVLALLKQMNAELGITLVLVTHDLSIAEQADRIVRLSDGRLLPEACRQRDGQP